MLQPEESENFSYGLVYQPGWLEGLQVELDRFDIEITDTISSIGDQNILEQCYSDTPQYCEHVDRLAGGFVDDLRSTAYASWNHNAWSARWSLQHITEANGVANSAPSIAADGTYDAGDDIRVLDATLYNDVIGSYALQMGDLDMTFSLGVSNLFDQDPPFFPESFANDFDPDYRAWSSRFWYGRVQVQFN